MRPVSCAHVATHFHTMGGPLCASFYGGLTAAHEVCSDHHMPII